MTSGELTLEEWRGGGERKLVALGDGTARRIFFRVTGDEGKPWITLLHGFPTCSWDYARIAASLEEKFRILSFDFLGFGFSDKPRRHTYCLHEQADITVALWKALGIGSTFLVAHDYATSVAQELLARRKEGALTVRLRAIAFLNGGMYSHQHRPLIVQKLLRGRVTGPLTTLLVTRKGFARNMSRTFSAAHPLAARDADQLWSAVTWNGGNRLYHKLIRYMDDRKRFAQRWEQALETTDVPLAFIWGLQDPISGAHLFSHLRERVPAARFVALEDVGHYPHLEVPDVVSRAVREAFG